MGVGRILCDDVATAALTNKQEVGKRCLFFAPSGARRSGNLRNPIGIVLFSLLDLNPDHPPQPKSERQAREEHGAASHRFSRAQLS